MYGHCMTKRDYCGSAHHACLCIYTLERDCGEVDQVRLCGKTMNTLPSVNRQCQTFQGAS